MLQLMIFVRFVVFQYLFKVWFPFYSGHSVPKFCYVGDWTFSLKLTFSGLTLLTPRTDIILPILTFHFLILISIFLLPIFYEFTF
jgi:hypothetical protein